MPNPTMGCAGEPPFAGSFHILTKFLGAGQFGEVWKADAPGGAQAAIKILDLHRREGAFEYESLQRLLKIRHPNLAGIQACWVVAEDGYPVDDTSRSTAKEKGRRRRWFIRRTSADASARNRGKGSREPSRLVVVLELGDKCLFKRLRECVGENGLGGIPGPELIRYMEAAAIGLDYLHKPIHDLGGGEKGAIVHRDIKPDNILVVGDTAKVCDFGLAKVEDPAKSQASKVRGTPFYMAPEVLRGSPANALSDQYSFAVSYLQLRTNSSNISEAVKGKLPPDTLPAPEQKVIAKGLSVDPEDRFASCVELLEALKAAYWSGASAATSPARPIPKTPSQIPATEACSHPPAGSDPPGRESHEARTPVPVLKTVPLGESLPQEPELPPAVPTLGPIPATEVALHPPAGSEPSVLESDEDPTTAPLRGTLAPEQISPRESGLPPPVPTLWEGGTTEPIDRGEEDPRIGDLRTLQAEGRGESVCSTSANTSETPSVEDAKRPEPPSVPLVDSRRGRRGRGAMFVTVLMLAGAGLAGDYVFRKDDSLVEQVLRAPAEDDGQQRKISWLTVVENLIIRGSLSEAVEKLNNPPNGIEEEVATLWDKAGEEWARRYEQAVDHDARQSRLLELPELLDAQRSRIVARFSQRGLDLLDADGDADEARRLYDLAYGLCDGDVRTHGLLKKLEEALGSLTAKWVQEISELLDEANPTKLDEAVSRLNDPPEEVEKATLDGLWKMASGAWGKLLDERLTAEDFSGAQKLLGFPDRLIDKQRDGKVQFLCQEAQAKLDAKTIDSARRLLDLAKTLCQNPDRSRSLQLTECRADLCDGPNVGSEGINTALTTAESLLLKEDGGESLSSEERKLAESVGFLVQIQSDDEEWLVEALLRAIALVRHAHDREVVGRAGLANLLGRLWECRTAIRVMQDTPLEAEEWEALKDDYLGQRKRISPNDSQSGWVQLWMAEYLLEKEESDDESLREAIQLVRQVKRDSEPANSMARLDEKSGFDRYSEYVNALASEAGEDDSPESVVSHLSALFPCPVPDRLLTVQGRFPRALATAVKAALAWRRQDSEEVNDLPDQLVLLFAQEPEILEELEVDENKRIRYQEAADHAEERYRLLNGFHEFAQRFKVKHDDPELDVALALDAFLMTAPDFQTAWEHSCRKLRPVFMSGESIHESLGDDDVPLLYACARSYTHVSENLEGASIDNLVAIGACGELIERVCNWEKDRDKVLPDDLLLTLFSAIARPLLAEADQTASRPADQQTAAVVENFHAALADLFDFRTFLDWPFDEDVQGAVEKWLGQAIKLVPLSGPDEGDGNRRLARYHLRRGGVRLSLGPEKLEGVNDDVNDAEDLWAGDSFPPELKWHLHGLKAHLSFEKARLRNPAEDPLGLLDISIVEGNKAVEEYDKLGHSSAKELCWLQLILSGAHLARANQTPFFKDEDFSRRTKDLEASLDWAELAETLVEIGVPSEPYMARAHAYEDLAWLVERDSRVQDYRLAIADFQTASSKGASGRARLGLARCYVRILEDTRLDVASIVPEAPTRPELGALCIAELDEAIKYLRTPDELNEERGYRARCEPAAAPLAATDSSKSPTDGSSATREESRKARDDLRTKLPTDLDVRHVDQLREIAQHAQAAFDASDSVADGRILVEANQQWLNWCNRAPKRSVARRFHELGVTHSRIVLLLRQEPDGAETDWTDVLLYIEGACDCLFHSVRLDPFSASEVFPQDKGTPLDRLRIAVRGWGQVRSYCEGTQDEINAASIELGKRLLDAEENCHSKCDNRIKKEEIWGYREEDKKWYDKLLTGDSPP